MTRSIDRWKFSIRYDSTNPSIDAPRDAIYAAAAMLVDNNVRDNPREALYAYTMGGAVATGDESNRGSIESGKWADFAVLSGNPLRADAEALPDITVDMTVLAGRVAFEA